MQHAQLTSSSKRPHSPPALSLRSVLVWNGATHPLLLIGKAPLTWISYLFLKRQGRIPSSGAHSTLPDSSAWVWPYGWGYFLLPPFLNEKGEGPVIPATSVRSEETDVSNGTQLAVQYSHAGKVILFMSVFKYVRLSSDRRDARRFVMGMRICGANYYVHDGHRCN